MQFKQQYLKDYQNNMNNNFELKNNKGFTMVETLVAVAILMISIAGPLTIAQKGLLAAIYAKDQVVASFLAQDAMESIKNYRDFKVADIISTGGISSDWLKIFTDNGCAFGATCSINTIPTGAVSISACGNPTPCSIYLDNTGYGSSNTGKLTQFTRKFTILNQDDKQATVKVTVEWFNGTVQNAVNLESQIFNITR